MSFDNISIPFSLNSSSDDPISDFFIPVLKEAVKYDVAVGYFTSGWIRDAAPGIAELAKNGGKIRWLISPQITKEDWEVLSATNSVNEVHSLIERVVDLSLDDLIKELEVNTRNVLAWMIIDGIFEFKIAIPTNYLHGIYHAKIGVFEDDVGNRIAFTGSYNMTSSANTNWETIDTYSSLDSEQKRINKKQNEFETSWLGNDRNLSVYVPSDKSLNKFVKYTEFTERPYTKKGVITNRLPSIPTYFLNEKGKLREHQEKAIQGWLRNNARGIFSMATGAGKTVTALAAIVKIYQEIDLSKSTLIVIITVPLKHLAEQWKEEAVAFGFDPVMCFSDYPSWPDDFMNTLNHIRLGQINIGIAITVNATFFSDRFQNVMSKVNTNFMIVADEMHNLGAADAREKLPESAKMRIGLSATPQRHMDEIGTKALYNYFDKEIIEYGIKEAIEDGTLTPYYYYPVLVEFTDDEMIEYTELSNQIAIIYGRNSSLGLESNPALEQLLMKRSRLIAGAKNKLVALKKLLVNKKTEMHVLVYVGATKSNDERQIDEVLKILGTELGISARKFTSDEGQLERKEILTMFAEEELQAIVAIKCLDEGVDIPSTKTAYILASSTNPREFIQRRGRVLRKSKGKKFSYIYDFVVVPPEQSRNLYNETNSSIEKKLFSRELSRVNEFANVAYNKGEALITVNSIKNKFNLLDM